MPKVTIRKENAVIEISDLSLDEVKELAGLNGHSVSSKAKARAPKTAPLFHPSNGEPDYGGFYEALKERGRKFFAVLRQHPQGITGEALAEKLGFSEPVQIGGLTGAGLSPWARTFNVDLHKLYVKERKKLDTGAYETTYKPGPEIAKLQ